METTYPPKAKTMAGILRLLNKGKHHTVYPKNIKRHSRQPGIFRCLGKREENDVEIALSMSFHTITVLFVKECRTSIMNYTWNLTVGFGIIEILVCSSITPETDRIGFL